MELDTRLTDCVGLRDRSILFATLVLNGIPRCVTKDHYLKVVMDLQILAITDLCLRNSFTKGLVEFVLYLVTDSRSRVVQTLNDNGDVLGFFLSCFVRHSVLVDT